MTRRRHRVAGNGSKTTATIGVGSGSVIAGLISWQYTQSVLWTLLHVILGWLYVIYMLIVGRAHL